MSAERPRSGLGAVVSRPAGVRPVVALVDWGWGGHTHTYYKHFLSALGDCGATVLPVVFDRAKFADVLRTSEETGGGRRASGAMNGIEFAPPRALRIRPSRVAGWLQRARTFRNLGRRLRSWERESGRRVDLVMFACMWDAEFASGRIVSRMLAKPWAGLYLQARAFHALRGAPPSLHRRAACRMFGTSGLVALGVLEPDFGSWLAATLPRLSVRVFPDVVEPVDCRAEPHKETLARGVRAFAGERPIVALLGTLQPSKGIELFLRAALDPRLSEFAFVLAGEIQWWMFDGQARRRVEGLLREATRVHSIPRHLTEVEFNSILREVDVLFAVYKDFPYSSNVQVKAAQFHKPLVVSEGGLMAERSARYGLGEAIPEDDLEELVRVLPGMVSREADAGERAVMRAKQDEFVKEHGYPAVRRAMEWVLECAATGAR